MGLTASRCRVFCVFVCLFTVMKMFWNSFLVMVAQSYEYTKTTGLDTFERVTILACELYLSFLKTGCLSPCLVIASMFIGLSP